MDLLYLCGKAICTPHQIYFGDQIKKNEMSGACSTYGGEERHIQGFGGEINRLKDAGIQGK
jgi:hypothetical protein